MTDDATGDGDDDNDDGRGDDDECNGCGWNGTCLAHLGNYFRNIADQSMVVRRIILQERFRGF